jgi:transposase-like protein
MTAEQAVAYLLEGDGLDVLRESLTWVCQQLMEAEVSELVGAARGERAPEQRLAHRNSSRSRAWQTRAGEIELQIPKIRRGSDFSSFLEPRRRSEQALVSVVQEAYLAGVSTRTVDQLVESGSGEQARGLVGDSWERLRKALPKVAAPLEEAEEDLLAFYAFPYDHWPKLPSTNPLERVNREIGRRTDVVGTFPNDRSLIRLAASVAIEQNGEWLVGRRYVSAHSLEAVLDQEKASVGREEARELTAA